MKDITVSILSMGPAIRILPESLSHRIAAGEVIERPVSVVKELVENSLDAGATSIEVYIEAGGKELIRVVDNGNGIAPDDARLAFERYATSKIKDEDDLDQISSFGFRGEALPSIAAISRVTLMSSPRTEGEENSAGVRIRVEGGNFLDSTGIACASGADVRVADLFYNTPARRKFLRADATESRLIHHLISKMALAAPDSGFRLVIDGREVFRAPARGDLSERVRDIIDQREAGELLPVGYEVRGCRVRGFLSAPEVHRGNAQSIYTLVNRRVVSDRLIFRSVLDGYGMMMAKGRYPVGILSIEIPPGEIDVNVHPAKLEVRFRNPGMVHYLVKKAVEVALARPSREALPDRDESEPVSSSGFLVREGGTPYQAQSISQPDLEGLFPRDEPERFWGFLKVVGQLGATYLLCQSDRGLVLVDQHAAHERICFTRLKENWSKSEGQLEELLLPETIELGHDQARLLEKNLALVKRMGLHVEPIGGDTFIIRAVNRLILSAEYEVVLREILDQIAAAPESEELPDQSVEPILARVACHGSIRANRRMERDEMEALIEELKKVERSPYCPHGRPVYYEVPYEEIEKWFLRR